MIGLCTNTTLATAGSHDLRVEKVLEPEPGATYPVCLKGSGEFDPERFDVEDVNAALASLV